MRTIFCLLLGLIAMFFVFIGTMMPLMLPAQAAKDRVYYEQFSVAAIYIAQNGKAPSEEVLRKLGSSVVGPSIWPSLTTEAPIDCDPSFEKAPNDRFVLSFWRGEWSECYAYPSGRTTLSMSVREYMHKGLGLQIVIYWFVAVIAAWGAIRIRPRRQALASIPNGG